MKVDMTKRVARSGTALAVNMTRELKALGLGAGDLVHITLSKPLEEDMEE